MRHQHIPVAGLYRETALDVGYQARQFTIFGADIIIGRPAAAIP
jgi:hypothetical protein